jgi:hypothetical protein
MKTITHLIKMYFKGYRLISLCEYNPEADEDIYCLIHKSNIPFDFKKKDHQHWLFSIDGYRTLQKYGINILIK